MNSFIIRIFILALLMASSAQGQTNAEATQKSLEKIYSDYRSADYEKALSQLVDIQENLSFHVEKKRDVEGLVHYWKGLCLLRMNEFERGIEELNLAIEKGYKSSDLYYEYGQALYTSLKLKKARVAFKKSILQKYKIAVSMYYIASISQELGDYKTAASFYNGIERLPMSEKKEVVQAARMQLGDIYLEQIKKQGANVASVERYVLPQYRKALDWDKESPLANEIRAKIENIQRRYDLVLFKLRNGRPTARPPYFLKANVKYTQNDNVNSISEKSKALLDPQQYAAASSSVGAYGRYALYPSSSFSLIPQFDFGYTQYQSDEPTITQNNNYHGTATLQTTYEHSYNNAPATTYLNIDYTYTADDADQDDEIEKASTTTGFTLSEEVQIWAGSPSIFRLKRSQTASVEEGGDFSTTSGIYEQVLALGNSLVYLYSAFDMTEFPDFKQGNNNSVTFRADALLPDFKGLFNTNLYASIKQTEYVEDSDRGNTSLNTYGVNLNRPFGRNYFVYLDFSLSNQTGKGESDNFDQKIISLNLDYIF